MSFHSIWKVFSIISSSSFSLHKASSYVRHQWCEYKPVDLWAPEALFSLSSYFSLLFRLEYFLRSCLLALCSVISSDILSVIAFCAFCEYMSHVCKCHSYQRMASHPLELKLQVIVSHMMWVLGTELWKHSWLLSHLSDNFSICFICVCACVRVRMRVHACM